MINTESYRTYVKILQQLKTDKPHGCLEVHEINDFGQITSVGVQGFSKSGTIKLLYSYDHEDITALARYDETQTINDYDDLVSYAFTWYRNSYDRGYELPEMWVDDFLRLGYIKTEVVTKYTIA